MPTIATAAPPQLVQLDLLTWQPPPSPPDPWAIPQRGMHGTRAESAASLYTRHLQGLGRIPPPLVVRLQDADGRKRRAARADLALLRVVGVFLWDDGRAGVTARELAARYYGNEASCGSLYRRLARLVDEGSVALAVRGESQGSNVYTIPDFTAYLRQSGKLQSGPGESENTGPTSENTERKQVRTRNAESENTEPALTEARARSQSSPSKTQREEGAIAHAENLSDPKGVPQLVARLNVEEARASGAADRWSVHHADPQRISDGHGGRVYSAADVRRQLGCSV